MLSLAEAFGFPLLSLNRALMRQTRKLDGPLFVLGLERVFVLACKRSTAGYGL